jgi:RNA recognition motif-containing protein
MMHAASHRLSLLTMTEKTDTTTLPEGDRDEYKVFVSRIPAHFDESSVKRLLEEKIEETDAVANVALVYHQDDAQQVDEELEQDVKKELREKRYNVKKHRGFAFVSLKQAHLQQKALALGKIRGGAKATSTKKFTLYLRPVVRDDAEADKQICFLWTNFRCPYGDQCKFSHEGDGGCIQKPEESSSGAKEKKQKCFAFKKGKCMLGGACPYSHDFEPCESSKQTGGTIPHGEKDCINWKTKGKCRKGDKCPYRHDDEVREAALAKRKRKMEDSSEDKPQKIRQPLSVRVFGLNYDTKEEDVRQLFSSCGAIAELTFPVFEDSGRSKGYCGLLFQSPKAVAKAIELDGKELHGRWLRVQEGKMFLKKWEEHHNTRKSHAAETEEEGHNQVGEFGHKVKRRKQHGFTD